MGENNNNTKLTMGKMLQNLDGCFTEIFVQAPCFILSFRKFFYFL